MKGSFAGKDRKNGLKGRVEKKRKGLRFYGAASFA